MAQKLALLKKKAEGFVKSIERMPAEDRRQLPTKQFGEDYNKLLEMALEADPTLASILPPKLEFVDYGGYELPATNYNEVSTFCHQIANLLP